jgi:hopanoid biosynthesis associated radical SAM protein HpnJ
MPLKTLFLNPPSFENFDGGAGSRWPATREIESYWYPVWLAYPAGMLEGARLLDAPPHYISAEQTIEIAKDYEFLVLFTSTPGFPGDIGLAAAIKAANPKIKIAFVGPHVSVLPEKSLRDCPAIDFVVRKEFDYAVVDYAKGKPLAEIAGISFLKDGKVVHNPDAPQIQDLDALPHVTDVYKRDLDVTRYNVPFLLNPYVSLYTTRGCPAQCTFCLWPQTLSGHPWRKRSTDDVAAEMAKVKQYWPEVKEFFFDDDTFTDDRMRSEAIARELGKLGMVWSCNAKANVPRETLKVMRDNGLRLLLVGYESGNQQILHNIRKGMRVDVARRFTKDCHELGIAIHGTFILGLPGESKETIEETIRFASEINPHTIQVSLAAPYPGTELHREALEHGWLDEEHAELIDTHGVQMAPLHYPHLSHTEIFHSVEDFYRRFYFRAPKIASIASEMVRSPEMMRRRLREGLEFFSFLRERRESAH